MQNLETISLPYPLAEFTSIIDVRTPLEFAEDHLPNAVNIPVLSNEQRVEVGTLYKADPFAARILGARYISLNAADHLLDLQNTWDRDHQPLLYCWRGGLRSQSLAHIIRSVGWRARVLKGGYKGYRSFVMTRLEELSSDPDLQFQALSGLTGVGKTRLLKTLQKNGAQILDLEGLANHRGSLLGSVGPQPSQKLFENHLEQALSRLDFSRPIFTEAESNRIGRLYIPAPLWKKLGQARLTEICLPLDERVQLLRADYPDFIANPDQLAELLDNLRPLRGHELVDSWHRQIQQGEWQDFLRSVLRDHYDLCYRPAGSEDSRYPEPSATIEVPAFSSAEFETTASMLQQSAEISDNSG